MLNMLGTLAEFERKLVGWSRATLYRNHQAQCANHTNHDDKQFRDEPACKSHPLMRHYDSTEAGFGIGPGTTSQWLPDTEVWAHRKAAGRNRLRGGVPVQRALTVRAELRS